MAGTRDARRNAEGPSALLLFAEHKAEEVYYPVTVAVFIVVPGEGRKAASGCVCPPPNLPHRPLAASPFTRK